MRLIRAGLVATLVLACGGEPEAPARAVSDRRVVPGTNSAPVIRSIQIVPAQPTVGDQLSLNLQVSDPDGDRLETTIEWFRNGRTFQAGDSAIVSTVGFTRGDQLYAVVQVSDGSEVVTQRTPPVNIVNQLPRVTRIQLAPEQPHAGTELTAVAAAMDGDGDPFELSYQWVVNDKPVASTDATLKTGLFKRGDDVRVDIIATDPYGRADPVSSAVLRIPNAPPEITSSPTEATVGAGRYKYVVKAVDSDRDRPLRYRLVESPDGMTIDLLSGVITWRVPGSARGSYPVEVAVSDPQGAETRQRYDLELHWESTPADTP